MAKPILLLNIAWMRSYRGVKGDTPEGTFAYMRQGLGTPHEVLNFLPTRGYCYGYAPVRNGSINIARLGASSGDEFVDDVLVVWTATQPGGGRVIIGWYDGARVFAQSRERPETAQTRLVDSPLYCSVVAPAEFCRLLSLDERVFEVPQRKKNFPGSASAFFPEGTAPEEWVASLRSYLTNGTVERPPTKKKSMGGRSVDPAHRVRVEEAAVKLVTKHYEKLRYEITSFEPDNVGWDLEATQGIVTLRLEVKGLSGKAACVEVTPNEYKAMTSRLHQSSYRLCIVTDALSTKHAKLRIFAYDPGIGGWLSEHMETLKIAKRTGARISVTG